MFKDVSLEELEVVTGGCAWCTCKRPYCTDTDRPGFPGPLINRPDVPGGGPLINRPEPQDGLGGVRISQV